MQKKEKIKHSYAPYFWGAFVELAGIAVFLIVFWALCSLVLGFPITTEYFTNTTNEVEDVTGIFLLAILIAVQVCRKLAQFITKVRDHLVVYWK